MNGMSSMSGTTVNVFTMLTLVGALLLMCTGIALIAIRKKRAAVFVMIALILFAVLGAGVLMNFSTARNATQHEVRLSALTEQRAMAARLHQYADDQRLEGILQQKLQFGSSSHTTVGDDVAPLADAVTARSSRALTQTQVQTQAHPQAQAHPQGQVTISPPEDDTLVLNMDALRSRSAPNHQFAPIIPTTLPPVVIESEVDTGSSCESETFPCLHSSSFGGYILRGGAFGVLLILAYLFLDAGKRGRYTWPMRFGTAALFTAVCVLLLKSGRLMMM